MDPGVDMRERLSVGGREFEGIQLIPNPDANAGFCALMTYALNGVRTALDHDRLPVVNYDEATCPLFYDPSYGENVWEYYFEPVFEWSYEDVRVRLESGELDPEWIHVDDPWDVMRWHHSDPDRIATFWASDVPEEPAAWMASKRELGRRYVGRFIKVRPRIMDTIEEFCGRAMRDVFTFGAHVRGTDFAYAQPTPPEAYFDAVDRVARERGLQDFRVFLATDQQQFVDLFRERFGSRLLTYDAVRSSGEVAPFRFSGVSPYKKGEDVLIDTLLMSRCDYLLKCAAAGGEYALWFNPTLECTDFGLESSFDTRRYHRLESAYLKLNVDARNPLDLRARRALGVMAQYLRTRRGLGSLPYRAWRVGRKALRRLTSSE